MADESNRGHEKLLAAVIAQAIKDAAAPIRSYEQELGINLSTAAKDALAFLHSRVCNHYASLIGIDHEAMLDGLRRGRWKAEIGKIGTGKGPGKKTAEMAETVKFRMGWYAAGAAE